MKKRKVIFRPVIERGEEPKKQQAPKKDNRSYKKSDDEYKNTIIGEFELTPEKSKIVFSLCRNGEFGLPHFDIRLHIKTLSYVGPTRMGVQIPLNLIDNFIDLINKVYDVAEEKKLFDEYKED